MSSSTCGGGSISLYAGSLLMGCGNFAVRWASCSLVDNRLVVRSPILAQGCRVGRCVKSGSYPRYTGRPADVVARAAVDPELTSAVQLFCAAKSLFDYLIGAHQN
jgi:hypothetical protein